MYRIQFMTKTGSIVSKEVETVTTDEFEIMRKRDIDECIISQGGLKRVVTREEILGIIAGTKEFTMTKDELLTGTLHGTIALPPLPEKIHNSVEAGDNSKLELRMININISLGVIFLFNAISIGVILGQYKVDYIIIGEFIYVAVSIPVWYLIASAYRIMLERGSTKGAAWSARS